MNVSYYLVVIVLVLVICNPIQAQEKTEKQLEKEARRELKLMEKASRKNEEAARLQANFDLVNSLVDDSTFVVEAHTLFGRTGTAYPVNSSTNFILVDGKNFTMQIASNTGFGRNGLGGITLDGEIIKYQKFETKKDGVIKVSMEIMSLGLGSTSLLFTVNGAGDATARIRGSFRSRITFQGLLIPREDSRIYKGIVTY